MFPDGWWSVLLVLAIKATLAAAFFQSTNPPYWGSNPVRYRTQKTESAPNTFLVDHRPRPVSNSVPARQPIADATSQSKRNQVSSSSRLHAGNDGSTNACLRLIIAGAPASGKGTQCELIKERYGVVHLSTGDMLRAAVSAQTDVGKLAKSYMDAGRLVPDEVIINIVRCHFLENGITLQLNVGSH
jgi:hypothetical protein